MRGETWRHRESGRVVTIVRVAQVLSLNGSTKTLTVEMRPLGIGEFVWLSDLTTLFPEDDWAIGQGLLSVGSDAVAYEHDGLKWVRDLAEFKARFEFVSAPEFEPEPEPEPKPAREIDIPF